MKKHKLLLWNIIILASFAVVYSITSIILSSLKLAFTHYVTYSIVVICYVFLVSSIVQIIILLFKLVFKKGNKAFIRIVSGISSSIITVIFVTILMYTPMTAAFLYKPAHIVQKEGKTMEIYVDAYMQKELYYYDYKNFFIRGNQVKIYEDCGSGGSDPFKNGGIPYVYRSIYYDDNGKIIRYNEE